ncbi:hypothetical protein RFI_21292 [Reticulomyxa filosa]|uniref:Uncharacterized protein n=1 Tax=Reticulomyxa filosa TaxID=46433 RepID=X6MQE4_RETFI|nr:hypothetical protein RFI_21292 [Reticulomyxa filosa]|eukprot:ETO16069.1 hypothetical protein RFI_21292 [Reticulomyxa filosa]
MTDLGNEKQTSTQQAMVSPISSFQKVGRLYVFIVCVIYCTRSKKLKDEEEEIQIIIQYWIRILHVQFGWISDFNKLVINYVMFFVHLLFIQMTINMSKPLFVTFTGHTDIVYSIDYSTFDSSQLICSGSIDKAVRVWDVDNNKQIRSFNEHSSYVYSVRFSSYHYHNLHHNVICSSSYDSTIRFWDIKNNQQLNIYNGHTDGVSEIEFSPFNGGRYLCSGSHDKTIRLWDVETSKSLHIFNGHISIVWCLDISPLQSNNSNNDIGIIGGNGYTICSGSFDRTIRLWDIETAKQLIIFKGHERTVWSVKYGSNELGSIGGANTILSGSADKSIGLWDIRSGQQIQMFYGHTDYVNTVQYSPFVVNNNEIGGCSNVICSGSSDNTIRFWDIRSNKKHLYVINGSSKEDDGIRCLKFVTPKKRGRKSVSYDNIGCGVNLCYGLCSGCICIYG